MSQRPVARSDSVGSSQSPVPKVGREPKLQNAAARTNVCFLQTESMNLMGVWRPERRNRNIGTKRSGHSKSNDMRIPETWLDKHGNCTLYYERLGPAHIDEVTVGDSHLSVLFERPLEGFSYCCSPADVIRVLTLAAQSLPATPNIIAFRQPTRKQRQQSPVWGRFLYFADFGRHEGTAIVLEAQELGASLKWSKRMTLDDRAEYERLICDGYSFMETKRYLVTKLSENTVRNTMLYRTLLHELGHLAEYHQKVLDDQTALDPDKDVATDLYFSRPTSEREAFAQRFADELRQFLMNSGAIPFEPEPIAKADI